MTGSIGVILHTYNYRELMDKVGVRPLVFKSGKFKDTLRADKSEEEILPEEMAMMQDMINETYTRFKDVVRAGREKAQEVSPGQSRELVSDWESLADGRILSGSQAFEAGFVDEIGDFEDALKRAKIIAGIPDAKVIKYQRPVGFGDFFRLLGKSDLGHSGKAPQKQTLQIDLGWNRSALQPGRLYFMTPTFMGSGSTME
jgi:protease-4